MATPPDRSNGVSRGPTSAANAAQYFEKVIELDPEFALAWSGLADAYMILPEYAASVDLDLVREKSVAAATRAYALDPESPEVLASLAWRRLIHEYDWEQAEKLLRRALEIHPHNTSALHWLSHVLSWQGRHTEAIELARRAVEADPGSTLMRTNLSYIYMDAGAFDESIRIAEETWERDPGYGEQMGNLYLTHLRAGRPADAARAMQLWAEATARDLDATEELGGLFVRHARGEAVRVPTELLDRGDFVLEDRGQLYAFFGDTERTLASLERAVRERSGARSALSMKVNPLYDPFRSDPRFVELMRRVGLAP